MEREHDKPCKDNKCKLSLSLPHVPYKTLLKRECQPELTWRLSADKLLFVIHVTNCTAASQNIMPSSIEYTRVEMIRESLARRCLSISNTCKTHYSDFVNKSSVS